MRNLSIPQAPNPDLYPSPIAWQRAMFDWMQRTRGVIQDAHNQLARPCGQQISATDYTTNTAVTGTTTGTDLANALCSLIAVLQQGGVTSPTTSREQNQ